MATGRVPTTANSPLTAKGDLFGYSTTQARVPVGNDGETLVADSAATTGLRYSAGVPIGNPVINGAMDIWQRGTSIPATTTTFAADRWQSYRAVAGSTFSRQATGDTTNLPNIQYCMRVQRDSGNTATNTIYFAQSFETSMSIPFAGKTVTYSFYARAGSNFSAASSQIATQVYTGTGTDQNVLNGSYTNMTNPLNTPTTLTTTWQRFSYTFSIASTATEIGLYFYWTPTGTAGANDYLEITGVQLDVGSTALPFRRAMNTLAGELAACQRYYYRPNSTNGANYSVFSAGAYVNSSTLVQCYIQFPVTMRVSNTGIDGANLQVLDALGNGFTVTSLADGGGSSQFGAWLNASVSGATAGRAAFLRANASNSAYIGINAEL